VEHDIGWEKILATALVSSFFTACLTEPVKAIVQRRLRRNDLRRSLYREILNNFKALLGQVEMAKHENGMKVGIGQRFAMCYRRLAHDLAHKDAAVFYSLGQDEMYWIELLYGDFEHLINGPFVDEEQRLSNAESIVNGVLVNLKNRHLKKRLMFKISPQWERDYFREHLPKVYYLGGEPLTLSERLRRRYDRAQYRFWRKFC
jgi:hypothetical protein